MATEIELKVWIDDVSSIKERLSISMVCTGTYTKHDEYWRSARHDIGNGIRLRVEEDGSCIVNWKRKEVHNLIEVNDEHEFSVSSRDECALLLEMLGLHPGFEKSNGGPLSKAAAYSLSYPKSRGWVTFWNWRYLPMTIHRIL